MAMLAMTDDVRGIVWEKYQGAVTTIRKQIKTPHLALLTTTSALGRSSLFNRINYSGKQLIIKIGFTAGWGHFHLSDGNFRLIRQYLNEVGHPVAKRNRFGQGPNWKIRTIRTCLELLGLTPDLLLHGLKREVYVAPLAGNYRSYLLGQAHSLEYFDFKTEDLIKHFKQRWFFPRAERCPEFREVRASETLAQMMSIARM